MKRATSFFDHDKPWYAADKLFVRFDGLRKSNATLMSCTPRVSCYDGHNGYDLDLHYESVLSAAAGTVIRAGWYNHLNHRDAFGLWIALDHGNGYVTAYGHLSAVSVAVGKRVGIQQRIGTSGSTGASTGPHLHFGTYYYPRWRATDPFGWSGKYANPNVVPDYYLWASNPGAG
jgi:murein DD-endopeptidase MepM/ murein hydrolase activator NlpD